VAKQGSSCLGCFAVGAMVFVGVIVLAIGGFAWRATQINSKFEFVSGMADESGDFMQLFVAVDEFSDSELREFVRDHATGKGNRFEYITIFDDRSFAAFPTNPFTAGYTFLKQEDQMRHIKASWTRGKNGFEELLLYETNSYDGKPREVK
jgi:hypothetical protein